MNQRSQQREAIQLGILSFQAGGRMELLEPDVAQALSDWTAEDAEYQALRAGVEELAMLCGRADAESITLAELLRRNR